MGCGPSTALGRLYAERKKKQWGKSKKFRTRNSAWRAAGCFRVDSSPRVRQLSSLTNKGLQERLVEFQKEGTEQLSQESNSTAAGPLPTFGEGLRNFQLQVACMSRAGCEDGVKKVNQDSYFAFDQFMVPKQSLFGCFDGHGPYELLRNAFSAVNTKLTSDSSVDCEFSGSTAVVALLQDSCLHVGWVGDSRAVLGRKNARGITQAIDLTCDHKPSLEEEKSRILKCNGRVERLTDERGHCIGPHRVWTQNAWVPGLAMSRAIGDTIARKLGVISMPDTNIHDVDQSDCFIILASDGVWEFIDSNEAVQIINKCENLQEACRLLVDEAYHRWLTQEEGVVDDVSAVIVKFIHH